MVIIRDGEPIEAALRRFRNDSSDRQEDARAHRFHRTPAEVKRMKALNAKRRGRKRRG